jgi:subfamily B ATP-binding cassette protein MsbA
MSLKLPQFLRNLIKATSFWKDNYLILREFKHFRRIAVLAVVFSIVAATLEGVTVSFIASFLQGLTNPEEPPIQTGMQWFDTWFLATEAPALQRIYRLAALIVFASWLRVSFEYLAQIYSKQAALSLVDRLRRSIFEQLQSLSLSFYAKTRAGDLMSIVGGEVGRIQEAFNLISVFVVNGTKLLSYLVALLLLSWQLFIAMVMVFGLISVALKNLNARVREVSFEVPKANKQFTSTALGFINGIQTVHASGTQEFERKRFYQAVGDVYDATIRLNTLSALIPSFTQGVGATVLIGMVVVAYNLFVVTGQLHPSELLAFLFVLVRATPLSAALNSTYVSFMGLQGALYCVMEFLTPEDKPYQKDGHIRFAGLKQSIDFVSVDFGYNDEEPVLHNITLSIKQGEMTALVGGSGAGKSTLAALIPRFYDPTRGKVLVDGVDLRDLEINSLRHKMAIVSQDTFIFNTTVRENIAYGFETIDDDAVYEAARVANALEFINDLPKGFETYLGDRGVRLSGGQRQRIAIARAILRNPEILILDEATSALDSVTERLIQEALERLAVGRTVIAIAHRLSTIVQADKVVVLEQGRIVEQGTYQGLLEQRGSLWNYHQMQYRLEQIGK